MVASPIVTEDRPLTIEDLNAMPDDGQRYELLQGELIVSPAPGRTHQRVLIKLLGMMGSALEAQEGLGEVGTAPFDVQLSPNDVVQPDLFVVLPDQADRYGERSFDGAPAFVLEVISPSSGTYDRIRKASLYVNSGVQEYWIIDPLGRRILVHDAGTGEPNPRIVTSGTLTSRVVPTFTVDLGALFAIVPSE
jgi:Uma2 family endonuclease